MKTLNTKSEDENKELNEFQESNSELPMSEVLSAKDIRILGHERRRSNRKKVKVLNKFYPWDLSGGLFGI